VVDRLLIVSNRLPIALTKVRGSGWQAQPSPGGLVTALTPVLRRRRGLWFGWPGTSEGTGLDKPLAEASQDLGYALKAVPLSKTEINQYYLGFSNEIVWPLFHDFHSRCNFDPIYWKTYRAVNRRFAKAIEADAGREDYVWVHDYHLMLVARELRRLGVENRVGFFLHIPFPPLDIYLKLPWRAEIIEGLLEYDLIGFQTPRDRNNFLQCVQAMFKGFRVDTRRRVTAITIDGHETMIGNFPISIDFMDFARQAASKMVTEKASQLRQSLGNRHIILGVDRLDYSKGVPEKLRAFGYTLERFRDLREKITMVQILVPSREDILGYQILRTEIEDLANQINGKFARPGWTPIQHIFRTLGRSELLAYYRAADIALITPLKDGMNLVAKEYCAAKVDRDGVLILSEFAGAASQLHRNSLLVNPYDIEGIANAIRRGYHMSASERQLRMQRLRKSIARRNVFWWANSFIWAAANKGDEYLPISSESSSS